jgi:hypothetical protein
VGAWCWLGFYEGLYIRVQYPSVLYHKVYMRCCTAWMVNRPTVRPRCLEMQEQWFYTLLSCWEQARTDCHTMCDQYLLC